MRIVFTAIIAFVFYTLGAKAGIGRYTQIVATAAALSGRITGSTDNPKLTKARQKQAEKAHKKAVKRVRSYKH